MGIQAGLLIVALLLGAVLGYRKGIVDTLIRLVSVLGAYALAVVYFLPLSAYIKEAWQLSWVLSYGLASLGIFLFGTMAIAMVCRGLLSLFRLLCQGSKSKKSNSKLSQSQSQGAQSLAQQQEAKLAAEESKSRPEPAQKTVLQSILGALLGAGLAGCLALVAIWGLGFAQQGMEIKVLEPSTKLDQDVKDFAEQAIASVGSSVIEIAVEEDGIQRLANALLQRPAVNIKRLQRITKSPVLQDLLADQNARKIITAGDGKGLAEHPKFAQLLQDPDLQALFKDAGLQRPDSGDYRQQASESAMHLFQKVEQLRSNPEAQTMLQDEEFRKKIEAGNVAALLLDDKFDRFIDLINTPVENKSAALKPYLGVSIKDLDLAEGSAEIESEVLARPAKKVYRWTDDKGRVHYTDKDPG